jgi:hypothetical protein
MVSSTLVFFSIMAWGAGYIDNRFRISGNKLVNVPLWLHLICGFPRLNNIDTFLTYEGLYMQVAACILLLCALSMRWTNLSFFLSVIISFLLSLIITEWFNGN